MPERFDPELIELTRATADNNVLDLYKVGGGTLGRRYVGAWGYRLSREGVVLLSGEDFFTGMPTSHNQAANLALTLALEDDG